MPELTCHRCGVIAEPVVFESGPHIRANCSGCGRYIKFLPRTQPFVLFFGKYKGRTFEEISGELNDRAYIEWLAREAMNDKVRQKAAAFLESTSVGGVA